MNESQIKLGGLSTPMVNAVRGMTALLKAENVIKTAYQPARYRNAT